MHAVLHLFFFSFLTQGLSVAQANLELLVLLSAEIMRLNTCTTLSDRGFNPWDYKCVLPRPAEKYLFQTLSTFVYK